MNVREASLTSRKCLLPGSYEKPSVILSGSRDLAHLWVLPKDWTRRPLPRVTGLWRQGEGGDRGEMVEREGGGRENREHPEPPPAQGTYPTTSQSRKHPQSPPAQGTPRTTPCPGNIPNHPTVQGTYPTTPQSREHTQPPGEHTVHLVARVHLLDAAGNLPPTSHSSESLLMACVTSCHN